MKKNSYDSTAHLPVQATPNRRQAEYGYIQLCMTCLAKPKPTEYIQRRTRLPYHALVGSSLTHTTPLRSLGE